MRLRKWRLNLGADVILVSGPTALNPPLHVTTVQVESAQDMLEAVLQHYQNVDVVIKTAAVADYRPKYVHENKMKSKMVMLSLNLKERWIF